METILTVFHVLVCIFLVLVVLLQAGKGGGMGSAFGGGSSSGSVFGGSGAGNFLSKLTIAAATGFMLTSMVLAFLASRSAADPLQRYDAQQRLAEEQRQKAHQDALGTPEAPTPNPDDGAGTGETLDPTLDDEGTTDPAPDNGETPPADDSANLAPTGEATPSGDTGGSAAPGAGSSAP